MKKSRHPGMLLAGITKDIVRAVFVDSGLRHAGMTFVVFSLVFSSQAHAVNKNVGTSGAQFLKIGAGARPTAMGNAFVGIADDVNAVYYNPAGLGFLEKAEIMAMHMQYFQGLDYDFGAFAQPLQTGAFAISASTLKTDDLDKRGLDESYQGTFTNQDAAYAFSYGRALGETLSIGGTARWIRAEIDNASAQAWSGDIGLLKRFYKYKFPLSLGFAIRHFGQSVKFNEEGDPLPLTLDAGAGIDFLDNRLKLGLDMRHVRDTGFQYGLGTEWRQTIGEKYRYAVRGGYDTTSTDIDGTSGVTLGAGIGYRLFDIDFAWVPFGNLGNTFRYAAHIKF